ncbi:MAG: peptidylprolyl isomerase [Bacteroidaceae bacterium]|nr:peptidylprolyl isomerase [Bacteroidaceae bacterium]
MKYFNSIKTILALLAGLTVTIGCRNSDYDKLGKTEVTIETDRGKIVVRLYDDTPTYRDNFVKLVRMGAYDGAVWHRIVRDGLIQAGTNDEARYIGKTLPAEIVYPRHFHKAGAIAAAREDDDVNPGRRSSNTQFYIVTGKVFTPGSLAELHQRMADADPKHKILPFSELQKRVYTKRGGAPHLDGSYTVFGEVVEGLGAAQSIGHENTVDEKPVRRLVIKKIYVSAEPEQE